MKIKKVKQQRYFNNFSAFPFQTSTAYVSHQNQCSSEILTDLNIGENSTGLDLNSSHSIVNEVAKRLIFQYFPRYSVDNILENTLIAKIRYCRFVAGGDGKTSPLASACHKILLSDDAFVLAEQQSLRYDSVKYTPKQQRHAVTRAISRRLKRHRRDNDTHLSVSRFYHIPYRHHFSRIEEDTQSRRISI